MKYLVQFVCFETSFCKNNLGLVVDENFNGKNENHKLYVTTYNLFFCLKCNNKCIQGDNNS